MFSVLWNIISCNLYDQNRTTFHDSYVCSIQMFRFVICFHSKASIYVSHRTTVRRRLLWPDIWTKKEIRSIYTKRKIRFLFIPRKFWRLKNVLLLWKHIPKECYLNTNKTELSKFRSCENWTIFDSCKLSLKYFATNIRWIFTA